jgi:hypothetical protein
MSTFRWRMRLCLSLPLAALLLFSLPHIAHAQEIAPPAPDETLVYVLRGGRFVGGGAKVWVAVNDQTVARLENKGYAVVRAKAGAITLNLASIGMVLTAVALDDRPGETVYLRWRLGDYAFEELSEVEGRELVAEADQTEPIDELLGNNEQVDALLNLSRLGFDLLRPATEKMSPSNEDAVLTILRREEAPTLRFGIWAEDRYIATLAPNEAVDIRLTPGEHFFLSGHVGTTLLKARVEAGKHYYAWVDVGGMVLRVKMMPVATRESEQLGKWLDDVAFVRLDSEAMAPRVRERETMVTDWVRSVVDRAKAGTVDFTELGAEHAF